LNRNTVIAIVIVSLLVIGGLVFVLPALFPGSLFMTVTFYDDEGNVVFVDKTDNSPFSLPKMAFAPQNGDVEVTHVKVTINWEVAGQREGSTLTGHATGSIQSIYNTQYNEEDPQKTTSDSFTMSEFPGMYERTFLIDDLILSASSDARGQLYGWVLKFSYTLTVTETLEGETRADSVTLDTQFGIDWADEEELVLTGTITGPLT